MSTNQLSLQLFTEAQKILVGGVNSPVRAFKAVNSQPLFFEKAKGAYLWDADGNRYIDYVGSFGPAILGHTIDSVIEAIHQQAKKALSFGAPCALETKLANSVTEFFPAIEKIRFVSSGTEATMSAIRLARGFTQKKYIIKFDGCYHGHADYLLVKAGSGATTLGQPDSLGVPKEFAQLTLNATFNNLDSVTQLVKEYPDQIAAVILEPIIGNMGLILPDPSFLEGLRELTQKNQIVLIFDEVMTGFRIHPGGAQALFQITPDLTCLGKVIGGGLAVGAFGGKKEIMELLAPLGPVYQAGTLSGNPLAMVAGLQTLSELKKPGVYEKLSQSTKALGDGISKVLSKHKIAHQVAYQGSMFGVFFTDQKVINAQTARTTDTQFFAKLHQSLIKQGVYLAPSAFEAGFVSLSHSEKDIEETIEAFDKACRKIIGP